MSKANSVDGKNLMLFTDTSSASTPSYKATALAKSCSLNVSAETKEVSSKDSGVWTEKVAGKLSWGGSSENLLSYDESINGYDALLAKMIARDPVKVCFGITSSSAVSLPDGGWLMPNTSYGGLAIITKIQATGPEDDKSTFSIEFEGTGELAVVTKPQAQSPT